jgi:hypothetical protein
MSLSNVINTADKYSPAKQENYRIRKHIVGALNFIINCFSIACFIAGNTLLDLVLNLNYLNKYSIFLKLRFGFTAVENLLIPNRVQIIVIQLYMSSHSGL